MRTVSESEDGLAGDEAVLLVPLPPRPAFNSPPVANVVVREVGIAVLLGCVIFCTVFDTVSLDSGFTKFTFISKSPALVVGVEGSACADEVTTFTNVVEAAEVTRGATKLAAMFAVGTTLATT